MVIIILYKKGEKIELEGKVFEVGGKIEVIDGIFEGLNGAILSIFTGEHKETDNDNEDVYVYLEEPKEEILKNKINNSIRAITNGAMLNMEDLGIDSLILSPTDLKPII